MPSTHDEPMCMARGNPTWFGSYKSFSVVEENEMRYKNLFHETHWNTPWREAESASPGVSLETLHIERQDPECSVRDLRKGNSRLWRQHENTDTMGKICWNSRATFLKHINLGDLAEGVRKRVFSLALFSSSHFNFNWISLWFLLENFTQYLLTEWRTKKKMLRKLHLKTP